MNRRKFLKDMAVKSVATIGFFNMPTLSFNENKSKNWVWITPDLEATVDDWKSRFDKLKDSGFDAILVEVYNGRYAFFESSGLPVKEKYLEKLIPIARSAGLEIHAWMWCMPCLVPEIQEKHPQWYAVNRLKQSALDKPAYVDYYKFLCPAKEEVHEFIRGTVTELAQFDVDGIHLDYIRYPDVILAKGLWSKYNIVQDKEYPEYDYCYCDTCRKKFSDLTGRDPLEIKDPSIDGAWLQFRYDQVTHLVNDILIPAGHKENKIMSAAVFPNWRKVRQEWRNWQLDAVLPMLYNTFYLTDSEWIKQSVKEGLKSLKHDTKLYSGIFMDEPEKLKDYAVKSFEGGAMGISAFALSGLTDDHLKRLAPVLKNYR
jgi:uncharacterized lipoprotein YddW (UPF0748 family)